MFSSNAELVESLKNTYYSSSKVEDAMKSVDRSDFVNKYPYNDSPQSIGHSVTISAPHMHAISLELLKDFLKPSMKALDIGSGSGYLTACMARMVTNKGKVIGIEYIQPIYELGLNNLMKNSVHKKFIEEGIIDLRLGDGWKGCSDESPFNAIHVGAAASKTPQKLIEQLNSPVRMIIPVGKDGEDQYLMQIDKDEKGNVTEKKIFGVRYVPLVNPDKLK